MKGFAFHEIGGIMIFITFLIFFRLGCVFLPFYSFYSTLNSLIIMG